MKLTMAAKTPAQWKTLFENVPFHRENYYTGPLGPDYTPGGTCLRLWAPTAEAVTVTLYHKGDGGAVLDTKPLVRGAQGVWSVWLPGEQHGRYYTFAVTVDGITRETGDPYARAAGVNGVRSMIVDLARTAPSGWERDVRPTIPPAQRAVWEVSVRDFSQDAASGVRPAWRGKYMAFTQQGTTLHGDGIHPTCLNYLKRLGVKYVQLMPVFDFGSVDEAKPLLRQYNWGYDPTNFNVPEGSYSTDPTRGEVRIRECREMIAALHAAGIGVVMDVVYNHTYRTENPLNSTVPYYFFRQNPDGSFSNGSGCGNEFASERPMARRYLIDSILYWAKEYHIDGFRFDLMGLYDAESINAVRAALDSLPGGRDILLYGEPWQGGASQLHRYEANKANLAMLNERVGIFCDDTRDAIKGGCFDAREPGYVEGKPGSFWDIGAAVAAWCRSDRLPPHAPSQIVSYVSAHDNFTLWDKLLCVRYEKPEFTARDTVALAQNRLAAGIYLTSFGLPFMQAGEEFARTKKGVGNSYRSSPALNRLDWNRAEQYHALVDYYRGLLALRAAFPRLGSTDRHAPEALQFFALEQPLVGWTLPAVWGDGAAWSALCVFYNPTETTCTVSLPAGQWKLLSDGTSSSLWRGQSRVFTGKAALAPYSATVFGAV
ncbi:type I pullulanase [Faecalibacterium prausnitzii]|uniref:type I pullulanase n=1 Tax=Faecalibacterium prausnitzii TaxID=853 RepID=UPI001C25A560|nr:type I pullulanase [Faecalibacterium prausnitzii]MBV0928327.1 type I pullulanase [Faecalibacterium prausnitzii]MCG4794506.1 type I pullulanase [Faecalibacterium prausnitzii]MCG4800296.1 type I pullulanase [Faecalibacterium prausnitzii]MDE8725375.1 type I pullulanase [Faecalibacterium prausnitzii]